ncbi:MAG: tRNA (N6-threonylcarbamoyladenosine(37)-N6)-methyltransferase TrmO [Bacteroidales bacterium]|nr:tRNA (N6-threonylcarbamoyladenosine(37)-N6)-methyltransferase TrmO [Bacteroidales bacterium]
MSITISPIAHIISEFPQKFGIPRQPLLAPDVLAKIVFEPEYRNPDCIRGLECSTHIWLIWEFTGFSGKQWQPLVRPPRLGGNRKMGVFATRSPLRPNGLGLSAVRVKSIYQDPELGPVIEIYGADMLDGTPIYDIKPYVPYTDSISDASTTLFSEPEKLSAIRWQCDTSAIDSRQLRALEEILYQDPRPAYKKDGAETYAFEFSNLHIEFQVIENEAIVTNLQKKVQMRK